MMSTIMLPTNADTSDPGRKLGSEWPDLPAPASRSALFLDVDAILLDPAACATVASPDIVDLLERLQDAFDGAVALCSARSIAELDEVLEPLRFPCAGVHGCERRPAGGGTRSVLDDPQFLTTARAMLADFALRHKRMRFEDKGLVLALHTGETPALEAEARDLVTWLAGISGGGFGVRIGPHVAELKTLGISVSTTLSAFLLEPPFCGRTPVIVAQGSSDEDTVRFARARGGLVVTVGASGDAQPASLDPTACRKWLARIVARDIVSDSAAS